jgi:methionine synthase II (cobalamin-independent)
MKREIVIKFEDVKNYIHIFSNHYVDEIIDVVEPFVMDYIESPFGFAETDDLNDIDECIRQIEHMFWQYDVAENKRERNKMIKETIKIETERWKMRNAWAYGRYIGRLAYLINKKKSNQKNWIDVISEKMQKSA